MIKDVNRYRAMGKKQVEMEEFTELAIRSIREIHLQRGPFSVIKTLSYFNKKKSLQYITSIVDEGLFSNGELCRNMFISIGCKNPDVDSTNFDMFIGRVMTAIVNDFNILDLTINKKYAPKIMRFMCKLFERLKTMLISAAERYSKPARSDIINIITNNIVLFIKDKRHLHNNKTALRSFIISSYVEMFNNHGNHNLQVPQRDIEEIIKNVKDKLKETSE